MQAIPGTPAIQGTPPKSKHTMKQLLGGLQFQGICNTRSEIAAPIFANKNNLAN
jgi:hypothetical protein